MNCTLTTTLNQEIYAFLSEESKKQNTTKKAILESALREYKKQKIREEIEKGFSERQDEYAEIAKEFKDVQITSFSKQNV